MSLVDSTGSAQSGKESCGACAALEKLFTDDDVQIYLHEWEIDGDCTGHIPLFQWLELTPLKNANRVRSPGINDVSLMMFGRLGGGIPAILARNPDRTSYRHYQILLHTKNVLGMDKGSAPISVLDPEWVDLTIAKTWMEKCIAEHTSECQSSLTEQVSPAWLIDTKDGCLVPGNDTRPFVALSYRWGLSTNRQMDEATFKNMSYPGSGLMDNEFLNPIVKDAIHTVREIGERFLWVDAICLEPDNEGQLAEQLQVMGSIYASAKLTIVALDGDASTGLKGLKSQSSPRSLSNIFPWKDGEMMVRHLPPLTAKDVEASKYFERGWTYQEYVLSPRRLIFGNQQIHWQCSCARWHEDLPDNNTEGHAIAGGIDACSKALSNIKRGLQDFRGLGLLLDEYNRRELTYPEDAFPAIDGLLTYIEKFSFEHGFLFGLPRAYFDAALMWSCAFEMDMPDHRSPRRSEPGLRRREPSARHCSILPNTYLPSWSWIGWKGAGIRILEKEAQFLWLDNNADPTSILWGSVMTTPITQWYSHASADGSNKQPISRCPTVYHEDSEISYDQEVWTRREPVSAKNNDNMPTIKQVGVKHLFEHVNFPQRRFMWPLPQMNPAEESTMFNLQQDPFISCRTKRLWFGALRRHEYNYMVWMDVHLCLFDKQRRLCGMLQLPNNEESLEFPAANVTEEIAKGRYIPLAVEGTFLNPFPEPSQLLELVAICLCQHPYLYSKDAKLGLEEFYGVMWVEWTDGVAYRRGCGYVKKELWDEQDAKDVDLILG